MAHLKQTLTLFDMTMIAIGATIGSGIFLTPSIVAAALPAPMLILGVWVAGGLMALSGGLTFAELAGMMPRAGGQYVYLKEAYGGLVAFLFGWAYFVVCNAGGLGALSVAFATYVGYFVPLSPFWMKAVAVTGLLLLTTLNVIGVKVGAVFSDVFTVLKIAGILSLAIVISTFGVVGIYTLTAPRIYYAMASDGLFFRKVAEIHPRFATPAVAIVSQSLWAVVLILFWGTFENLISYVVFTDWIFFALAAASVFILRRTKPAADRPYRVPGHPLVPLFFVVMSVWFVAVTLVQKPAQAWAGLAFLGLGVPVYFYWQRRGRLAGPA